MNTCPFPTVTRARPSPASRSPCSPTPDDLTVCPPGHAPPLRRRSLTLESHSHPFSGSSLGKSLEQKRLGGEDSLWAEGRHVNHTVLAGNLHYQKSRRRCFIDKGFVNQALELMIRQRYGTETWEEISTLSEARVTSPFILRMLYDDKMTYNIVQTASEVLGLTMDEIWEMFGETFFEFCEESGYDKILKAMGGTLRDFLENLDALHDHLSSIYPGMRAPTFRCTERPEDGALMLHYFSDRQGLEHVVIGLVKTVARRLHNKEVSVEIITSQSEYCPDHVQFIVTDKPSHDLKSSDTAQTRSSSDDDLENEMPLSTQSRISPASFCKAFPFHVMFNRDFHIVQLGNSIVRVIKELEDASFRFCDVFQIVRPQIEMKFDDIIAHSNSVFVIKVRERVRITKRKSICDPYPIPKINGKLSLPTLSTGDSQDLPSGKKVGLKGQMLYIPESDKILFLCSPSVGSLEELKDSGLYISDIPMHDSTRDLLLLSEQFRAEYELTQRLESMTDKLQQTSRELELEKQLTEKLVYSILPPSVANKLRENQPVEAVKYRSATILFSGICNFNAFCTNNPPIKVVNFLNELYTKFDALADPRMYNVYKVETVGDKYMLASGLPEKSKVHAKNIALCALDMMDIAREVMVDGQEVRLTIGVHSGPVVAGVVGQRLPRFAVFGGTVCVASRMESTGLADCINISQATFKYLQSAECYDSQFLFKERGDVIIKGIKCPMRCYVLSRNLRKLPKVQMLLESGIELSSSCPSPGTSPAAPILDEYFETSPIYVAPVCLEEEFQQLPDPTTQTLAQVAENLKIVATGSEQLEKKIVG